MEDIKDSRIRGVGNSRTIQVDMESYLSKHDIVYKAPPREGWEGFPVGNGSYGGMYWALPDGVVFQANHTDSLEDPDPDGRNEGWAVLRSCGRLNLRHPFPLNDWLYINRYNASLSMYNATARTRVEGTFGTFDTEFYVHAEHPVAVLNYRAEYAGALARAGSPVTVELERWGSRVFGWWYSGVQGGASMDAGEAAVRTDGDDLVLRAAFRGVDVALRCRIVGAGAEARVVHDRMCRAEIDASPKQEFTVYLACVTSREHTDPAKAAKDAIDAAAAEEPDGGDRHRSWWASYWDRSFLSVPEDYIENLYYLHLYLMGTAGRGQYPPVFNGGIWTWNRDVRNWVNPHHWNQQQSFWCLSAANRADLVVPYMETYYRLSGEARKVAAEKLGYKGLRWSEQHDFAGRHMGLDSFSFKSNHTPAAQIALFFWWHYRFTGDRERFLSRGWPFLDSVGDFFLDFITWREDKGEYEVPVASTYEDERPWRFTNTITTVSMAKRVLSILEEACEEFADELEVDQEKRKRRRHMLDHLPGYMINHRDTDRGPTLASGLVDGKEFPETETHGHGPLFCPVFPAGEIGLGDRGSPLFAAAVNTIATYPSGVAAITPTVVVAARLGQSGLAEQRLYNMVRNLQHFPNGMFFNIDHWHYLSRRRPKVNIRDGKHVNHPVTGGSAPDAPYQRDYLLDRAVRFEKVRVQAYEPDEVTAHEADLPADPFSQMGMESLGNFAAGLQEMLLQSHDGTIRVFPAVPDAWEGTFTLLAEGGFLVTSRRNAHAAPEYVEILSNRGGRCVVVTPWSTGQRVMALDDGGATGGTGIDYEEHRSGWDIMLDFPTEAGRSYLLAPEGAEPPDICRYTAVPNEDPKTLFEATLGKYSEW